MSAYYNEIDPYAAQWLRNLIAAGHIADGEVDERSIIDVRGDDLRGFTQCHFFAGIGVWSYALRLAGWPDDEPAWTGSCPCRAFSSAARGRNVERDLWPEWYRLIAACQPHVVFGEQVAQSGGWFDKVCHAMEAMDYEVGAAILPAVSVGADHLRPRIYFAGHANRHGQPGLPVNAKASGVPRARGEPRYLVPTDGPPNEVACLRAFGNAIHAEVAKEFIAAYMTRFAPPCF